MTKTEFKNLKAENIVNQWGIGYGKVKSVFSERLFSERECVMVDIIFNFLGTAKEVRMYQNECKSLILIGDK